MDRNGDYRASHKKTFRHNNEFHHEKEFRNSKESRHKKESTCFALQLASAVRRFAGQLQHRNKFSSVLPVIGHLDEHRAIASPVRQLSYHL